MAIANISGNILTDSGVSTSSLVTGTGTTNYLPKFTGASTLGDSVIQEVSGNIGIGGSPSGSYKFEVTGTGRFTGALTAGSGIFGNTGTGNNIIALSNNDQSNTRLRITNTGSGGQTFSIVGGNPGASNAGLAIFDETNSATRLYIGSSGNVGIGTSSVTDFGSSYTVLDVYNGTVGGYLLARSPNVTGQISVDNNTAMYVQTRTNHPIAFVTNNTERMRITSSGSVGIGCTPGLITSLDIQNPSVTSNNVFLRLQNNAASEDCGLIISGSYGTAYEHRIGVNTIIASKDLCFTNSSGAGFRWYTDGTQSLNLTSGGVLDLSFGQIKFPATQVASSNANTLDDYEEGTFTPDIRNGSWAFGARSGFYTKIGNLVTVNFLIVWTANNIPSGASFEITLPFAAFGSGNFRAPATIGYTSGVNFNTSRQLVAHVDMSNNYISFQQLVSGGVPVLLTNNDINNTGEIQISVTYQV